MYATYSRIILAPIFFILFSLDWDWSLAGKWAATIFILASISDWLDGHWARKYDSVTQLGQLMDPVADKILVLCALIVLLDLERIDASLVAILLARDIYIGGIRSTAAVQQVVIPAHFSGKLKTFVQMLSIPLIFLNEPIGPIDVFIIGYYGLWISVALSLYSGLIYTARYYRCTE